MPSDELNKILLVDDEIDIQTILRFALEKRDKFIVKCCSSGEEVLQQVENFSPDIILLDVMMPGMDGIATFHAIRKIPALTATPVIFMTAKVQINEMMHYQKLGALDVIAKPFDIKKIAGTLREIWRKYNEQRNLR